MAVKNSHSKRRSERILAQIPIVVDGKPPAASRIVERTRATIISAHGALISLETPVTLRLPLTLHNPHTLLLQECSVVYLGQKQGGRTEVGVAFNAPAPDFWGLEKLPGSWQKFRKPKQ